MEQVKHDYATGDNAKQYVNPNVKVVFVKAQVVLCQSGNEPMREYDYGDGGFGNA